MFSHLKLIMRDNRSLMSEALIDAILLEAEAVIYYSSKYQRGPRLFCKIWQKALVFWFAIVDTFECSPASVLRRCIRGKPLDKFHPNTLSIVITEGVREGHRLAPMMPKGKTFRTLLNGIKAMIFGIKGLIHVLIFSFLY